MHKRNWQRTTGELTQQERIWHAIEHLSGDGERFTQKDVRKELDVFTMHTLKKVIQKLRQADILETVGFDGDYALYERVAECDGIPDVVSRRVLAWRQQVWNALRIQRITTVPAIMTSFHAVDPAERTVNEYIRNLEKAGYVARAGRAGKNGQVMSHIQWRLVNDTGPSAPGRQQLEREIAEAEDAET